MLRGSEEEILFFVAYKMKEYYITFGQNHIHHIAGKTFDCNCVWVIQAENYSEARKIAFELTNWVFCFLYDNLDQVGIEYYPRGLIVMN